MTDFVSHNDPTARKNHMCQECGCVIPKGVHHYLQKGVYDGAWYSWRVHSDCAGLYWAINRDYRGCFPEDWLRLSDYCLSEIEPMRGRFPHAVCRQELRRLNKGTKQ